MTAWVTWCLQTRRKTGHESVKRSASLGLNPFSKRRLGTSMSRLLNICGETMREINEMEEIVAQSFEDLFGETVSFECDDSLCGFVKGRPLTVGDLKRLRIGDVVYVTYKERGEIHYGVDDALLISFI